MRHHIFCVGTDEVMTSTLVIILILMKTYEALKRLALTVKYHLAPHKSY